MLHVLRSSLCRPTKAPQASQRHVLTLDALRRLVALLSSQNRSVAEVAARVLASGCSNAEQVLLLPTPLGRSTLLPSRDAAPKHAHAWNANIRASAMVWRCKEIVVNLPWTSLGCSKVLWKRRAGL